MTKIPFDPRLKKIKKASLTNKSFNYAYINEKTK